MLLYAVSAIFMVMLIAIWLSNLTGIYSSVRME